MVPAGTIRRAIHMVDTLSIKQENARRCFLRLSTELKRESTEVLLLCICYVYALYALLRLSIYSTHILLQRGVCGAGEGSLSKIAKRNR